MKKLLILSIVSLIVALSYCTEDVDSIFDDDEIEILLREKRSPQQTNNENKYSNYGNAYRQGWNKKVRYSLTSHRRYTSQRGKLIYTPNTYDPKKGYAGTVANSVTNQLSLVLFVSAFVFMASLYFLY